MKKLKEKLKNSYLIILISLYPLAWLIFFLYFFSATFQPPFSLDFNIVKPLTRNLATSTPSLEAYVS